MPDPFETARRDINRDSLFAVIGECLRTEHAPVEDPLPEPLAELLEQLRASAQRRALASQSAPTRWCLA